MAVWVFFYDLNSGWYPRKKLHALVSRSARADATRALQLRKSLERRQPPGDQKTTAVALATLINPSAEVFLV